MITKEPTFYLTVKIYNPKNPIINRVLKLKASFKFVPNTYGNGYYLAITGREDCTFEQLMDLRYQQFNINNPEPFILDWLYNNWSGENGSFDIMSVKIENMTVINKTKTLSKNELPGNVLS